MTKKLFPAVITLLVCFTFESNAQCQGRYETELFSAFTKSTVQYSHYTVRPTGGDTLKMDIYEPQGDSFPKRPVVLLAHGGTFIAGNRSGSNGESSIVDLCEVLAKRGFVAASFDYRLAGSQTELFDSINALRIA